MHAEQNFLWHHWTFPFMAINIATTLILYLAQSNSFTHAYMRNKIELRLSAWVNSDWSPTGLLVWGHSKSLMECGFAMRSAGLYNALTLIENLLSDLLVDFKDLINTQRSKHSTHAKVWYILWKKKLHAFLYCVSLSFHNITYTISKNYKF